MDISRIDPKTTVQISRKEPFGIMVAYEGTLSGVPQELIREVEKGTAFMRKVPEFVFNGIMNVPNITIEYRGYKIVPKCDFGGVPYHGAGYVHSKGYVITDGFCNVMPGASWSHDIVGAKAMIDSLIESSDTGKNFWDILREKQGLSEWSEV